MRSNLLILLILLSIKCVCQDARMVLDSVYLVFNPSPTTPTYLVIENPNPSAISILDTSLIKSENEINKIRWSHVGIGGNYIIPFGTSSNVYIPLSLNIPSGNGSLVYSTYGYGNIPISEVLLE